MKAYVLGGRPILLPFLSGILRYECATCDAPCCKNSSLGVGRSRELVALQKVQPRLPLFAAPGFAGTPLLGLHAPREACWFFDDKRNRCRVEAVMGRDAKPAGCRLFPFHRIRALADALVILPDFTCPITVADELVDEGEFSHDEIVLEMHRTHIPVRGHPSLPSPRDLDSEKTVRLERRVVRAAERHLDRDRYLPYAEQQAERTAELLGPDEADLSELDRTMRDFIEAPLSSSALTVRTTVALTGVLRLMASPLPRQAMPRILLALAAVVDTYIGMKGARFSPRTVVGIFEQRLPFLYVLANLESTPVLNDGVDSHTVFDGFPFLRAPLVAALDSIVDNGERRRRQTLLEILDRAGFQPSLGFDEVAMLYALGRVLLTHARFPSRPR